MWSAGRIADHQPRRQQDRLYGFGALQSAVPHQAGNGRRAQADQGRRDRRQVGLDEDVVDDVVKTDDAHIAPARSARRR